MLDTTHDTILNHRVHPLFGGRESLGCEISLVTHKISLSTILYYVLICFIL